MDTKRKWVVTVGQDLNDKLQPGYRIHDNFVNELGARSLNVELKRSGTVGLSPGEAVVIVSSADREQWLYPHVTQEQVKGIVEKHLGEGKPIKAWVAPMTGSFDIPLLATDSKAATPPSWRIHSVMPLLSHWDQKEGTNQANPTEREGLHTSLAASEGNRWADINIIGLGWSISSIGLVIIFFVLGGFWLDNRLDTRPLFTLIGLGLGLATAAYGTYRLLTQVSRPNQLPTRRPQPQNQLKEALDELAETEKQADQRIEEMHHNGHVSIELAISKAKDRQNQPIATHTPEEEDLITQARARIAQDKAQAIARLRQEYDHLAANTGEAGQLSDRHEENQQQKQGQDAGGSSE